MESLGIPDGLTSGRGTGDGCANSTAADGSPWAKVCTSRYASHGEPLTQSEPLDRAKQGPCLVPLLHTALPMRKALGKSTRVLTSSTVTDIRQVPLDYSEPDGRQAAIALVRKPALIPKGSHLYRGPVLFNPGGPGGSGVGLILALGNAFSTIIGPQFDIVGFDPRGMSSLPSIERYRLTGLR